MQEMQPYRWWAAVEITADPACFIRVRFAGVCQCRRDEGEVCVNRFIGGFER